MIVKQQHMLFYVALLSLIISALWLVHYQPFTLKDAYERLTIITHESTASKTAALPAGQGGRWPDIPNIVHYVQIMKDPEADIVFDFRHFLSVYSTSFYLKPETIYIHTDASNASIARAHNGEGAQWTRIILGLPNVVVRYQTAPKVAGNGVNITNLAHRSDFARLMVSEMFGGIYFDFDIYPLRDFTPLRTAGFANVLGLELNANVNNGLYMNVKNSNLIRVWLKNAHMVFDGQWVTHAVTLLTAMSRRLVAIPYEILVLDQPAFAPHASWFEIDAKRLFGIHNDTKIKPPSSNVTQTSTLTTDDLEEYWNGRNDSMEEWQLDYSNTYAIHGFKANHFNLSGTFDLEYIMERRSNLARAAYPAVKDAVDRGVVLWLG